jgi:hypothetical protein
MKRVKLYVALLFINVGILSITVALLPKKQSNPWSDYPTRHTESFAEAINARERWDIAWLVLLGTLAITLAIITLVPKEKKTAGHVIEARLDG